MGKKQSAANKVKKVKKLSKVNANIKQQYSTVC